MCRNKSTNDGYVLKWGYRVPDVYMTEENMLTILFESHIGFTSFGSQDLVNSKAGLDYLKWSALPMAARPLKIL